LGGETILLSSKKNLKIVFMLKDILAISGQPGLFQVISRGNNSIIVESLLTGKRQPAHSSYKITSLEDIAIFTQSGEVPLKNVLKSIEEKEAEQAVVSPKASSAELKNYFKLVLPDFDENRVYVSDIKKLISWYSILKEKGLLVFDEEEEKEQTENK
jgi:hypothetical protein